MRRIARTIRHVPLFDMLIGTRHLAGAASLVLRRSPRLQLPRLAQIRVDPRLPADAGLAIGGEHIGIEPQLHRLFWIRQWRPAPADQPPATADFGAVEEFSVSSGASSGSTHTAAPDFFFLGMTMPHRDDVARFTT